MIAVYVGTVCQVGDRQFTSVGQKIELPEKEFLEIVRGGAVFVPEADFDKLGFTQQEITAYAADRYFGKLPDDYVAKLEQAREIYRDLRKNLDRVAGGFAPVVEQAQ